MKSAGGKNKQGQNMLHDSKMNFSGTELIIFVAFS